MRTNPHITIAELAGELQRSTRAIEMQIAKMQEQQLIRRVGPDQGGHWQVLE